MREIVVSARTEPNRSVELRAETAGRVVELGAERGRVVAAGEVIVALDMRERNARLEEAKANVAHMQLQYDGARKLKTQQFVSETHIAEALARVAAAQAALEAIEIDIAHTKLVAPFDAVLQERSVELGDYVNSGDTVAQLVDTDPLIVVGEISERDVPQVQVGGIGYVQLVNGERLEGRVRYVAPVADASTRTFRVELAVANPDAGLRAGVTAEMRLSTTEITAHVLSPALLTLADDGTVGVKTVGAGDRVEFHPIQIVGSSAAGITVSGLPETVRLITVGQGFVKPGEIVEPVLDTSAVDLSDTAIAREGPKAREDEDPEG
jgi:multidrug efflux system membrane fusion protein